MSAQKPNFIQRLLGADPDVKVVRPDGSRVSLSTFLLPTAIFMVAGLLLVVSMYLPYWQMKLTAPQYPKGLYTIVYVNRLEGDIAEIDELNHYLGMPKLDRLVNGEFKREEILGGFGLDPALPVVVQKLEPRNPSSANAFTLASPVPSPLKPVAVTVPLTSSFVDGLVVPMPTLPVLAIAIRG